MTPAPPTVLACEQVRFVDRFSIESLGIPGSVLMENAGRGCVDSLVRHDAQGPVLVLCGPGNNGGDGWVIARHLRIRGLPVAALVLCDPQSYQGDALLNWNIAQQMDLPIEQLSPAATTAELSAAADRLLDGAQPQWLVDALLGTGARGPLRAPYRTAVEWANTLPAKRFAVDIPTGLDAERGEVERPIFQADVTASFVAAKPGLVVPAATPWVGKLEILDIGLPPELVTRALESFSPA